MKGFLEKNKTLVVGGVAITGAALGLYEFINFKTLPDGERRNMIYFRKKKKKKVTKKENQRKRLLNLMTQ
jgi:hypothetical protein